MRWPAYRLGRRQSVLVVGALVVACAASAIPPAGAAADGGDPQLVDSLPPPLLAQMRQQERLHPAAMTLIEVARREPGSGYSGIAYQGDGITLHHKGPLSPAMAAAVATASASTPVTLSAAAHSHAELTAAAARIEAADHRGGDSDIVSIATLDDGSGLEVGIRAATPPFQPRLRAAADVLAAAGASVPVRTIVTSGYRQTSTRTDDTSPFNGGVMYQSWRPGVGQRSHHCTTGFGVWKNGQTYLLTAAHCMSAPDEAWNGRLMQPGFKLIGGVHQENWDKDLLLINARGFYWMFDGGPVSSYRKTVRSQGYRVAGELLCTSGSRLGVVCGHRTSAGIYRYKLTDSDGDTFYVHGMARAVNINGQTACADGDSGGPVFALDGDGVRAKGIISGKDVGDPTVLIYQDWDDINAWGVSARTN